MTVLAERPKPRSAPHRTEGPAGLAKSVDFAVVLAATAFVVWRLRPSLILTDTLPAGGDLSSHNWGPQFLSGRLPDIAGWSWDWFGGFPAFTFYPVLPALLIAMLDLVLPYAIAMKVGIALGPAMLVPASWAFARWWRLPFPAAPMAAVAALVFVFDPADTHGGTIAGTITGEYCLTLALGLGILALGLLGPVVQEGRCRGAAALVVAAAALAHPLGLLFLLVMATVLAVSRLDDLRAFGRRVLPVFAAGLAIAGVWWIPFLARRGLMTSPDFPRSTEFSRLLPFGVAEPVLLGLAVAGLALACRQGRRIAGMLAGAAAVFAVLYLVLPVGQLHNVRLLPFWSWCRLMLAAIGAAGLVRLLVRRLPEGPGPARLRTASVLTPLVALVAVLLPVGRTWDVPPLRADEDGVANIVDVAMRGYDRQREFPAYKALMDTMDDLGRERGCGRFMWSVDVLTQDFGGLAKDLAPYWTDGCITTLSGLYYDSSASTPLISLTEAEVAIQPLGFGLRGAVPAFNLDNGVRHMRYAGVRYYAARTDSVVDAADDHDDLEPVATSGEWHVYELQESELVSGLPYEPVVLDDSGTDWGEASQTYLTGTRKWDEILLARDGPKGWGRLTGSGMFPEREDLPDVDVDDIETGETDLRFRVDRAGVPVLVKASWFPTWRADGADGPYRVAGNQMVVIPRQERVRLYHGRSIPESLGLASLALGAACTGWLFVYDRRRGPRTRT